MLRPLLGVEICLPRHSEAKAESFGLAKAFGVGFDAWNLVLGLSPSDRTLDLF